MARNVELTTKRNADIVKRFKELSKKNTKWRLDAIIEQVAKEFYLTERSIVLIIKQTDAAITLPAPLTVVQNIKKEVQRQDELFSKPEAEKRAPLQQIPINFSDID